MKKLISNLGGKELSKNEQKNVFGGIAALDTRCRVILANGSGGIINFVGAATGSQVSAAANAWCVNAVINNGAGSCRYDCYYDGQG